MSKDFTPGLEPLQPTAQKRYIKYPQSPHIKLMRTADGKSPTTKKLLEPSRELTESFPSDDDSLTISDSQTSTFSLSTVNLRKNKIITFLESILHVDLSDLVLADITFKENFGRLTVVGRPKVEGSSSKQMNHVIPYSFVENLIQSEISKSICPQEVLKALAKTVLIFAKAQKGYAVTASDLETAKYSDVAQDIPAIANRSMSNSGNIMFFASPGKSELLKWTPTRKTKAEEDFSIYNTQFIKSALGKFSQALDSSNEHIATIASEALARFIFIIFNKGKHAAFAKEGNTASYEIRLYPDKDSAIAAEKDYQIMTARELQQMEITAINECIRIVDCEGSKVRETPKALKLVDTIIFHYNMFESHNESEIADYNSKYNYQLKLSNSEANISEYNQELTISNYQTLLPYHVAKLLYVVFDLKALETIVITPDRKHGELTIYNSASGTRTSNYTFDHGEEVRADQREGARGYSSNEVFRNQETDLGILAQKLAELFTIATAPFASIQLGFKGVTNNFLNLTLNKLTKLAAYDYQMDSAASRKLQSDVSEIYTTLISDATDTSSIADLSVVGTSDFDDILHWSDT